MDTLAGSGGGKARVVAEAKQQRSSSAAVPSVLSHAASELRLEALTRGRRPLRICRATTRRTLPAVCVVAAVAAAAFVLTAGWWSSPNEMPDSWFFDGTQQTINIARSVACLLALANTSKLPKHDRTHTCKIRK